MDVFSTPVFGIYAAFAAALCMLLMSIELFGRVLLPRARGTPIRPDRAQTAVGEDGPARVMATHRNALANFVPFLFLMLFYVLLGGRMVWVATLCGGFTSMRGVHTVLQIRGFRPPWRTIPWMLAQMCVFTAVVLVFRAALAIA